MLPLLVAAALAFPQPILPPRPVSAITWTGPLYAQFNPAIGWNGSMGFVAWADARFSNLSSQAVGTRIDADGKPLDPIGIVIPGLQAPEATLWTGGEFVVIGRTGSNAHALVSVGVDGSTSQPKPIDVSSDYTFAAVSSSGADARVLYIRYDTNAVLTARIVDTHGNVVVNIATPLAIPLTAPNLGSRWIAAGRRNDFGIFGPSASVRLDRDGNVLANTSIAWPFQYFFTESIVVAGNDGQGFVMLRQNPYYDPTALVLACQLDNNAAFTGKCALMDLPWIWLLGQSRPAMIATGDRYVVVNRGIYGDNSPHQYLSELSFDLSSSPREVATAGSPLLFRSESGQQLLVASQASALFLQRISDTLQASTPVLLNIQATTQSPAAVAATGTSYAVAWYEQGSDSVVHTYIRRWWIGGEPIDAAPLEVENHKSSGPGLGLPVSYPYLAATTDAYIVNGRRLGAAGGWIDDLASANVSAVGSNGTDFLVAVWMGNGNGYGLARLPSRGAAADPVALPLSTYRPRLASNGSDYLVVWNTQYICRTLCPAISTPVYALRVRSDGRWIDPSPIQLSPNGDSAAVAWTGASYVVSWGEGDGVHAARVAVDGMVLDHSTLIASPNANEYVSATVVPLNGDAVFFVRHASWSGGASHWTAIRVRPDDLASAMTAEQTAMPGTGQLDATSVNGRLIITYDSNTDPTAGYVPRVYVEQRADPAPRRRTSRP